MNPASSRRSSRIVKTQNGVDRANFYAPLRPRTRIMKGVTIAALILTLVGGGAVFRSDDLTRRGGSRVPLESRTGMRACAHGRGETQYATHDGKTYSATASAGKNSKTTRRSTSPPTKRPGCYSHQRRRGPVERNSPRKPSTSGAGISLTNDAASS